MKDQIEFTPSSSMLTITLSEGEAIKAEPGAMVAMQNLNLKSRTGRGGLFGGFMRLAVGETFFLNIFEANDGPGLGKPCSRFARRCR